MKKKMCMMSFDEDLKRRLKDPAFRRAYEEPDDDPYINLCLQMIRLRRRLGLSQAELARKAKTTQQVISRLESPNYRGHTVQSLLKVAKACHARLQVQLIPAHVR